jgi:hypothetical protein
MHRRAELKIQAHQCPVASHRMRELTSFNLYSVLCIDWQARRNSSPPGTRTACLRFCGQARQRGAETRSTHLTGEGSVKVERMPAEGKPFASQHATRRGFLPERLQGVCPGAQASRTRRSTARDRVEDSPQVELAGARAFLVVIGDVVDPLLPG